MLKDAGASVVIVGHSERRAFHGETSAIVKAKGEAALAAGLSCAAARRPRPLDRLAAGRTFAARGLGFKQLRRRL